MGGDEVIGSQLICHGAPGMWGLRVGVIGLGGLGHMAVKLGAGLGADVTVMSRLKKKEADAMSLGADVSTSSAFPPIGPGRASG
jgi:alcohol dehydrogenase (NADP+)